MQNFGQYGTDNEIPEDELMPIIVSDPYAESYQEPIPDPYQQSFAEQFSQESPLQIGNNSFNEQAAPQTQTYGQQWAQYENLEAQLNDASTQSDGAAADQASAEQPDGGDYGFYADMPMYMYDPGMYADGGYMGDSPYQYDTAAQAQLSTGTENKLALLQAMWDEQQKKTKKKLHVEPVLVLSLMLVCFPVGLALMYFCTEWGVFAKIYITLFVLGVALWVYEILVLKQVVAAPSLIQYISGLLS